MEQKQSGGIGGWIGNLFRPRGGNGEAEAIHQATEQAVQVADPTIRLASRYRKVLREPVAGAMHYCRTLFAAIPGPVQLSRDGYHSDPLVKALFASPEELEEVLRINPELNRLRQQGQRGEMTAMMTMLSGERTMFGHQQVGETLMRDVAMRAVSFSDHRIVAAAASLDGARTGVVHRGMEVLATVAMERITTLRTRRSELQEQKIRLKGMMKILGGRNHVCEMFAAPSSTNRDELRKAEEALAEVDRELAELQASFATPEHALGQLEAILRAPEKTLTARRQSFRLDWKGIRVDDQPEVEGHAIDLAEFLVGEELRRSAVLVTFALQPAAAA